MHSGWEHNMTEGFSAALTWGAVTFSEDLFLCSSEQDFIPALYNLQLYKQWVYFCPSFLALHF